MKSDSRHRPGLTRLAEIRWQLAGLADAMAEHELRFASYLDGAARRGDRERRVRLAATERRAAAEHRIVADEFRQSAISSFGSAVIDPHR